MESDDDLEIIKSNKGGLKVIHKGYMYTVHKRRQCGGIRWRCAQRSLNCKGSISTGAEGTPKINMPHNHLPDLYSVALARGRQVDEFGDLASLLELKIESPLSGQSPLDSIPLQERLEKTSQSTLQGNIKGHQSLQSSKFKLQKQGRLSSTTSAQLPSSSSPSSLPPKTLVEPLNEEMCLRWNSHHSNMQTAFPTILSKEQYVDVTLAAEGKTLKCHRLILSSCSPYFDEILSSISPSQHPVLFMKDIPFWILKLLCDFMYCGEVHIFQDKLEELLMVAEALKIKGLAGKTTTTTKQPQNSVEQQKEIRLNQQQQQQPVYHDHDYDNDEDILDPLDLLEPFEEEDKLKLSTTTISSTQIKDQTILNKKIKKIRKRKTDNSERSPPPQVFSFRKGTRSRPNVKIPKYYHNDYGNSSNNEIIKNETKITTPSKTTTTTTTTDILFNVDEIKSEPIDVEDNNLIVNYNDDYQNSINNDKDNKDDFKNVKTTKPMISNEHTIKKSTNIIINKTIEKDNNDKDDGNDDDEGDYDDNDKKLNKDKFKTNYNKTSLLPTTTTTTTTKSFNNDNSTLIITSSMEISNNDNKMTSLECLEKEAMNVANSISNDCN